MDTPPSAAATPPPAAAASDTPPAPTPGAAPDAPPAPYEPNLKFKVMDKEHAMAEYLKDVIKDEKREKELKELYEKAYGLDVVKPKYQETRAELNQTKEQLTSITNSLQDLREDYRRGDFDSFFEKLKIPQEKILQWVVDKVNYNELPPEQRQALDARRYAERQAYEAQKGSMGMVSEYQSKLVEARSQVLDLVLERADVQDFGQKYLEKTGKSLRDAVIDYAEGVYLTRRVDLTPDQAVKEVMEHYGKFLGPSQPAQAPAPQAPAREEPPVIPHVGSKGGSPTGTGKITSVEGLRELYKNKYGQK